MSAYRAPFMLSGRLVLAALSVAVALPTVLYAQIPIASTNFQADVQTRLRAAVSSDSDLAAFYAARNYRPVWTQSGALGPEARRLLKLINTASFDSLSSGTYPPEVLEMSLQTAAGGDAVSLIEAEIALSRAFAAYAGDMRRPANLGMAYVDKGVAPTTTTTQALLEDAASAPSLLDHLDNIGWMHPIYGQLRRGLDRNDLDTGEEQVLRINLERARALPADPGRRYILVDAAEARLYVYEDGLVRDTMRVVVGKTSEQTPMMAGMIRYAMVNPYWNIPADLVRNKVAPDVLNKGTKVLRAKGYEVLSDWSDEAHVVDPAAIDWEAVAAGREEVRVRQLPGGENAMGKMKFMFPNAQGVYLHDTPERNLFQKADRRFSSGCVRVEDAPRLAQWLFGEPLTTASDTPEQKVDLPEPVPVYISYFTAASIEGRIAFRPDIYNRDSERMAAVEGGNRRTR